MGSRKLRFDGWVLDPESGDLEREGARMRLQEQPARVLQELVANAGSLVTRERLIALLWPKGVVDFDTSLNTAIRKLRSALGDMAETPRYIETLPRRGYRFVVSVGSRIAMKFSAGTPVLTSCSLSRSRWVPSDRPGTRPNSSAGTRIVSMGSMQLRRGCGAFGKIIVHDTAENAAVAAHVAKLSDDGICIVDHLEAAANSYAALNRGERGATVKPQRAPIEGAAQERLSIDIHDGVLRE